MNQVIRFRGKSRAVENAFDAAAIDTPVDVLAQDSAGTAGPSALDKFLKAAIQAFAATSIASGVIVPSLAMGVDANGIAGAYYANRLERHVENYRYASDPAGDDTLMCDRAHQASKQYGYKIKYDQKLYRVSNVKIYTKMCAEGVSSSRSTGTRFMQITGETGPVLTMDTGPVINVDFQGFAFDANLANGPQFGGMLKAVPQGAPDNNGGLWYSALRDIQFYGFRCGLWLRAGSDYLTPHQFNEFSHIHIFRIGDDTENNLSSSLVLTGQFGQTRFTNCQFDGTNGTRFGTNVQIRPELVNDEANFCYHDWSGANPTEIASALTPGDVHFLPGTAAQNGKRAFLIYRSGTIHIGAWTENVDISYDYRNASRGNTIADALCTNGAKDWAINLDTGCTLHINGMTVAGELGTLIKGVASNQCLTGQHTIRVISDMQGKTSNLTRQKGTGANPGTLSIDGNTWLAVVTSTTPISYIESWHTWNVDLCIRAYDGDVSFTTGGNIAMPLDANGSTSQTLLVLHKGECMIIARDDFGGHVFRIKSIIRIPRFASAMPTSGQYARGEFVHNSVMTVDANGRYLKGWYRVTNTDATASNHAVMTDWRPEFAYASPKTIGQVTGASGTPGVGQIAFSWTAPNDAHYGGTKIYTNTVNDFGTATLRATETGTFNAADSRTVTGLAAGSTYAWLVATSYDGTANSTELALGPYTVT
ncbi:hypothetical protein HDIA_0751 [Hartmannibacter diazotrophicus]|uniref:Uncharacterized protein n=1 Tax=Hartmannibacter diazotrophicus TaxID=1482074 RepID=A0A2C9D1U0_9HYPH|nr:hypothetical protein [Hartmannibacter diazotrophicus]SON54292.1 hypothetical protein HDIA_0751 [Hartmannibacter diazotrophicus]